MNRDELLELTDEALFRQCRYDRFRASGPGGQHRNTADSAVRLTLPETGISVMAADSRSQNQNRRAALRKLRIRIAMTIREDAVSPWDGPSKVGRKDARYPAFIATMLDALHVTEYKAGDAARQLDISTGRLVRLLASDPKLWAHVNEERERIGLKPLRK